jgi:hypothetical protein
VSNVRTKQTNKQLFGYKLDWFGALQWLRVAAALHAMSDSVRDLSL